ncbi:polyketide synthase [Streptomyces sp. JH14]|uniref:beta-ketoacyl [acyl carrier protein] synthase domain-containing protein n=1 Tax=Streptomyces sp. JH14 TaxID=2793630 RepID=UPI0023F9819E|nr:polyketide synthase [Streptomyces sp. JH14]MDF6043849.1 polyketide synthase [Streptomyces sp. JH14]
MKDYIDSIEQLSHKQLVVLLARQRLAAVQGIAVDGMALRLPGGVDSPRSLWSALRGARVVTGGPPRIPVDSRGRPRWNTDAPDLAPYADLLGRGAYVDVIDVFDAKRFGLSEEEAGFVDPQQRLLVTCAAEALADAGIDEADGLRTGVFAALSSVEYQYAALRNQMGRDELSAYMGPGGALSGAAGRIATCLGLCGPSLTVDTACSSALTALHLACASLRSGECDVALVGACNLLLAPGAFGVQERAGLLSPSGRSRPFDAAADGYARSEGCGVVVLRRQPDAVNPYAVVRGTAVYQHGARDSISRVSAAGQAAVIRQALRAAGCAPDEVGYVEAQANGVRLAGVIEAEVLGDVFARTAAEAPPLVIGSAKANLGYLETTSGMAGLMKAVLSVQHGEIPPQPDLGQLDPDVPWQRLGLRVPREITPWPDGNRRLAGVSAYGFTGTYGHAVVEAAATEAAPRPERAAAAAGDSHWHDTHHWS